MDDLFLRATALRDCRQKALPAWMEWSVRTHATFTYTESDERWLWVEGFAPAQRRCDCSSGVTGLFRHAGAVFDPNRSDWRFGDTETLLAHGKRIPVRKAVAGDVLLRGMELPLGEQHAEMVYDNAPIGGKFNPLCWSMGEQGDPRFTRADYDPRSQTYVRFRTASRQPKLPPKGQ